MKEIKLTGNKIALVDDEDFDLVSRLKWHANKGGETFYAEAHCLCGSRSPVRMHKLIMGAHHGKEIDHKNGNGLDNRKSNLRFATDADNAHNSRLRKDNASGFKGVSAFKSRWKAQIQAEGRPAHIGYYDSPRKAAIAYDIQAIKHFGAFAKTNGAMGLFRLCSR